MGILVDSMYALKQRKQLFPFVKKSREDEWTFEPTTKVCLLLSKLGELGLLPPSFPSLAPKLLENSKLALMCCSDDWRGWVSNNNP